MLLTSVSFAVALTNGFTSVAGAVAAAVCAVSAVLIVVTSLRTSRPGR